MEFRAAQYTSRAMRGPLRCPYGTCGVAAVAAGLSIGDVAGVVVATISFGFVAPAGFFRDRRRFGIFCRSSHTRSVSSEIVTPSFASDCTSSRIDAPARRSASSTSRYGSSSANRRERGRRPSAINRASVWASPVKVPAAGCAVEGNPRVRSCHWRAAQRASPCRQRATARLNPGQGKVVHRRLPGHRLVSCRQITGCRPVAQWAHSGPGLSRQAWTLVSLPLLFFGFS
jgi:hypothetical protein